MSICFGAFGEPQEATLVSTLNEWTKGCDPGWLRLVRAIQLRGRGMEGHSTQHKDTARHQLRPGGDGGVPAGVGGPEGCASTPVGPQGQAEATAIHPHCDEWRVGTFQPQCIHNITCIHSITFVHFQLFAHLCQLLATLGLSWPNFVHLYPNLSIVGRSWSRHKLLHLLVFLAPSWSGFRHGRRCGGCSCWSPWWMQTLEWMQWME